MVDTQLKKMFKSIKNNKPNVVTKVSPSIQQQKNTDKLEKHLNSAQKKSKYSIKKKLRLKQKKSQALIFNLKQKSYPFTSVFQQIVKATKKINFHITIRVTPNNVFCTLKDVIKNKILLIKSAGLVKLKVSKKTLKFANKLIVQNFIEQILPILQSKTEQKVILSIRGPIKIRKTIIKQFTLLALKNILLVLQVLSLKCFNGCRPKKKKRKKQKSLLILK